MILGFRLLSGDNFVRMDYGILCKLVAQSVVIFNINMTTIIIEIICII